MKHQRRQVLEIDLSQRRAQFHSFADLGGLLGGLGLGLQLLKTEAESQQTILAIGPLTGLFPFASKFCTLALNKGVLSESYGSGRLALIMRFAQIDALSIRGISRAPVWVSVRADRSVRFFEDDDLNREAFFKDGLPGRQANLVFGSEESRSDGFFLFNTEVGRQLFLANLCGLSLAADQKVLIARENEYREVYQEILSRGQELEVTYSNKFSCGACPVGCEASSELEERSELVLSHCLVTCGFAQRIYESEAVVFACLNSLGLIFKHEDLELVIPRVNRLRQSFL